MHPFLNTAIKAAREAGDIIMRASDRVKDLRVSQKGPNDFVTEVDKAAENVIIETLRTAYPDHGFLAEESGFSEGNEHQWIIDPLDGTSNYLHGFPHFAVSISQQFQGRTEHAVVYDPIRDEIFWRYPYRFLRLRHLDHQHNRLHGS